MTEAGSPTRNLQAREIVKTLEMLKARVHDRFPARGLDKVCAELLGVARDTSRRVDKTRAPALVLRVSAIAVVAVAGLLALPLFELVLPALLAVFSENPTDAIATALGEMGPGEMLQAFESGVNLVILAGLAIWFLFTLETRWKRSAILGHLHELRSFAHVVDMHQLTKDPVSILNPAERMPTSPVRDLTPFQLARYLDYCVEMLSLIGKLAALYAEHSDDAVVIEAANDIEALTTNLSRKIWQKIQLIGDEAWDPTRGAGTAPRADADRSPGPADG